MERTFLIVLSSDVDRDEVIKYLESTNKIDFWFYSLPNSLFVNAKFDNASEIYSLMDKEFNGIRAFVTLLDGNYFGKLPKTHWELIHKKRDIFGG